MEDFLLRQRSTLSINSLRPERGYACISYYLFVNLFLDTLEINGVLFHYTLAFPVIRPGYLLYKFMLYYHLHYLELVIANSWIIV